MDKFDRSQLGNTRILITDTVFDDIDTIGSVKKNGKPLKMDLLHQSDADIFKSLYKNNEKVWRSKLHDSYDAKFMLDESTYNNVNHYLSIFKRVKVQIKL